MKITIENVDNNEKQARQQLEVILAEAVEKFNVQGSTIEEVKINELSVTYSFKTSDSEDFYVAYVEHADMTEMFEVTLDLETLERSDNEEVSNFNEEDYLFVNGGIPTEFDEIEPTFDLKQMTLKESEGYKDMIIMRFDHEEGFEVVRVYQEKPGKDAILIQEYSLKEK